MNAVSIHTMFVSCVSALATRIAHGNENTRVKAMRKEHSPFHLDIKGAGYLAQSGIKQETLSSIFPASGNINPTVPYRFTQFVNAMHAGLYGQTDATTARALIALRMSGGTLSRDALVLLLTGKVKIEGVSPETRGVGVRALDKYIGRIGRGTVETQLSRSFGTSGFACALGMVNTAGKTNFVATLNPDNLFSRRFFSMVDAGTDSQLEAMTGATD